MDELLRGLSIGLVCYGALNIIYHIMTFTFNIIYHIMTFINKAINKAIKHIRKYKVRTNEKGF